MMTKYSGDKSFNKSEYASCFFFNFRTPSIKMSKQLARINRSLEDGRNFNDELLI